MAAHAGFGRRNTDAATSLSVASDTPTGPAIYAVWAAPTERALDDPHVAHVDRLRLAEAGLARLDELAESGAAPDAVIDRLRSGLQDRIGSTRARIGRDPGTEPGAMSERELRGDLIAAEGAELARLFDAGEISVATRQRLQRSLDLEISRLTEGQR